MADEKMDWSKFVSYANEQYGTDEYDWEPLREAAIVRFDYDDRGYVSGKARGKIVFRDNHFENDIMPGETWIVSLTPNPKTGSNYFAKPVKRIDASFMFELKKDQMELIADYLWKEQRTALEPFFEERYKEALSKEIAKAAEEARAQYEARLAELNEKIAEMERTHSEDMKVIDSLEHQNEELKHRPAAEPGPQADPASKAQGPAKEQSGDIRSRPITVIRKGPDSIECEDFTKSRYYVHLSADHKFIVVQPSNNGNVICVDRRIDLEGLNMLAPFECEEQMPAEYNGRFGGIQIFLK